MKILKNCIKLRSQVKIYVPSTVNVDKEFNNQIWVDSTLKFLAEIFGGSTTSNALGAWITNSGDLIKEKVNLCFAFASEVQLNSNIEKIYDYCLKMKIELGQEAIALEVNGELYLV